MEVFSGCSDTQEGMDREWILDSKRTPQCSPFPDELRSCEALPETGDLEAESFTTRVKSIYYGIVLLIDFI